VYLFSKITPTPFVVSIFDAYVYPQVSHATASVYFYIWICSFYLMFLSSSLSVITCYSMPPVCRLYNPTTRRRATCMATQRQNVCTCTNFEQFASVLAMTVCYRAQNSGWLLVRAGNFFYRTNGKERCFHR